MTILVLAVGCRFGGPPASGEPSATATDATSAPDGDLPDVSTGETEGVSPSDAPASPPVEGGGGACVPPFVSERCDPVCNTGCPALSRCDVGAAPAQGVCIGIWIGGEGDVCLRTPTTDPCAPHLTCLGGRCHRLCYTDRECSGARACCNIQVEAGGQHSGYRACGACAP